MNDTNPSIQQLRDHLHREIDRQENEALLQRLSLMLEEEKRKQDTVVGYRPDGKPIVLAEFHENLEKASKQVKDGHFYTIEEIRSEIKKWG